MRPLKIIIFMIHDRYFALPSRNVKEIIDAGDSVKEIFYGGEALKGVANFDGDLISVLNTPYLLEMSDELEEPLILVCREKGIEGSTGLIISSVKGIEIIDTAKIKPSHGNEATYLTGFVRKKDRNDDMIIALMDLNKLFDYALTKIEKVT